jgi:hypothetical protein
MNKKTKKATDTGLAVSLILIITAYITGDDRFLIGSGICLFTAMALPVAYRPLAPVWFGFSHVLGAVVSRIFFSVIFFLVATPMGLIRRVLGKDAMKRKSWKQSSESVFLERGESLTADHLTKPF